MRRLIIVALLFLLMSALPYLQVAEDSAFHPKSLAALGFVLLAAYTLGEITGKFKLPKITGYIVTGLLFGPYVINLFSVGVVEDIKLINSLAVALIALTAGAEMKLDSLKAVARSLGWITVVKGSLILVTVTATVFAARPLIPFLAAASVPLILSVGMIFGVLAIGTSPAATIAVINETQSRGRLSDLTLGVAVAKDVVMVVLLAVAISLAKLFSTAGASFDLSVLLSVGEELLLSVTVGALLGVIIIAYIRFVHAEMWLFIIAMIFLNTFIAERFHLEALLTFIVAGFVVQNFSRYGDEFIHPVEEVSLPVYVVFFSIAGAGLDLNALRQVWLIALILVAVRIAAIFAGTRIAVTLAKEDSTIKSNAWLSFVSQAGVVLGLSTIVENNLPQLGGEIKTVVLGTVGLNLILGPITFKSALTRAGETGEQRESALAAAESDADELDNSAAHFIQSADADWPEPRFESVELNEAALTVRTRLMVLQKEGEESLVSPRSDQWKESIARVREHTLQSFAQLREESETFSAPKAQTFIHRVRRSRIAFSEWMREETGAMIKADEQLKIDEAFAELFDGLAAVNKKLSANIVVTQEDDRFESSIDDSFYVRLGKMLKWICRGLRRLFRFNPEMTRDVPFSRVVEYYCAGMLPPRLERVANLIGAQPLVALRSSRRSFDFIDRQYEMIISLLEEKNAAEVTAENLSRLLQESISSLRERFQAASAEQEQFRDTIKKEMTITFSGTYGEMLRALSLAGTFELPSRRLRLPKN